VLSRDARGVCACVMGLVAKTGEKWVLLAGQDIAGEKSCPVPCLLLPPEGRCRIVRGVYAEWGRQAGEWRRQTQECGWCAVRHCVLKGKVRGLQ